MVGHYYYVLRSILRDKPHLRKYLVRCKHCRIFFLTYPPNAGRKDLGCPFGCKERHRKESAKKRSIAYYQTDTGKFKKKLLNERRSRNDISINPSNKKSNENSYYKPGENTIDKATLDYLHSVTSLIEGRSVRQKEILAMLIKKVRQHSIAKMKRVEYNGRYLIGKPP